MNIVGYRKRPLLASLPLSHPSFKLRILLMGLIHLLFITTSEERGKTKKMKVKVCLLEFFISYFR